MRILSLAVPFLILFMAGRNQDSPHGNDFKINCSVCHSPKGWELDREIYSFDHNTTQLPLEGQHTSINCKLCHPTLVFSVAETDCFRCHTDMHQQTVGMDCARCHTPKSWIVNNITDVHRQSRFPLQGPHAMANCLDCHPSASLLRFEPQGVECEDCHMQDFQSTTNPNHMLGNFSTQCIDCHSMNAFTWGGSGYNHSFFPLTQGHAVFDCNRCHTGTDYADISADCSSCHQEDYNTTTNPGHLMANLSTNCMECHTTQPGWKPAQFDHAFFSLTQGHAIEDCNKCHDLNNYASISTECISCHLTDYNATTNPNHLTAELSTECMECHTTIPGWKPAAFEHINFPLTFGHAVEDCNQCHDPGNYANASAECFSCHQSDYDATTNPNHLTADISNVCMECHTTMPGWTPAFFEHINFPLTFGHTINDCNECHDPGDFSNVSTECFSCHETDYNATTNPNHLTSNISNVCMECHTTMPGWTPAFFDHINFPLTFGHAINECNECHDPGDFSSVSTECFSCHETDYNATTNPNHIQVGISNVCMECHTTMPGWTPAIFDHTSFPLTQGHATNDCNQCHDPGNFSNVSTECLSCHLPDYNATTNPNHPGAGINTACMECHSTMPGWTPAIFDHTSFPLTQGHATNDCNQCHDPGNFSNVSTECISCHQPDYNATTNPSHLAAGISTVCMECHTTLPGWKPAKFPIHDAQFFPIYSGKHNGQWNSCTECHSNTANYALFSCLDCHEHSRTAMDDKHSGENGYEYTSFACLDCHPRGSKE